MTSKAQPEAGRETSIGGPPKTAGRETSIGGPLKTAKGATAGTSQQRVTTLPAAVAKAIVPRSEIEDYFSSSDDEETPAHEAMDEDEEGDPPLSNEALHAQYASLSADVSRDLDHNLSMRHAGSRIDALDDDHAQTQGVIRAMKEITLGQGDGEKRALALEEWSTVSANAWRFSAAYMRHATELIRKFVAWMQTSMESKRTMLSLIAVVKDICVNNTAVGDDHSRSLTELQAQFAAVKEKGERTAARESIGRRHLQELQVAWESRLANLEGAGQHAPILIALPEAQPAPRAAVQWGPPAAAAPMQVYAPQQPEDRGAAVARAVAALGPEPAAKYTYGDLLAMGTAMGTPEVSKGGGIRVPQPAKYSGEEAKVDVDDVMFTFSTYLTDTDVPKHKWASVAMHLLTGAAQQQYVTFAQSIMPATPTWEQFLQVMHQFAKPNKRFTALQSLMTLKQMQTVHRYVQDFKHLLARIGDPAPSATEQVIHFWRGLSEAAKQTSRVDPQGVFWTDPEALMTHACNVELSSNMTIAHKLQAQAFHIPHTPAFHLKAARTVRPPKSQEGRKTPKHNTGAGPSAPRSEEFTLARGGRGQGGRDQGSYGGRGYGGSGGRGGRGGRDGGQGPIPCRWCLQERTGKEFTHRDGAHQTYMSAYRDATAERRA
jgi:hypothetical protein